MTSFSPELDEPIQPEPQSRNRGWSRPESRWSLPTVSRNLRLMSVFRNAFSMAVPTRIAHFSSVKPVRKTLVRIDFVIDSRLYVVIWPFSLEMKRVAFRTILTKIQTRYWCAFREGRCTPSQLSNEKRVLPPHLNPGSQQCRQLEGHWN